MARFTKKRALVLAIAVTSPQLLCNAFTPDVTRQSTPCLRILLPSQLPSSSSRGERIRGRQHRIMTAAGTRSLIMKASPATSDDGKDKIQYYIRPYLTQLFLLCRPSNFPIVILFHVLGVNQAVQLWQSMSSVPLTLSTSTLLLSLLRHPSIILVLISLLLVTSTSMITNDYYDARSGVDSTTNADARSENEHYHPLAQGEVPLSIAKIFDSYLYAMLLLSSAFVPGAISRLMVLGGAILTYLYTVHLKPLTWIKNLSCAALVSMSPVTSGMAAWHVLCNDRIFSVVQSNSAAIPSFSPPPFHRIFKSPLSFLVVALFAGIMRYVFFPLSNNI